MCDHEWQMSVFAPGITPSRLLVSKADMLKRNKFEETLFLFVGKNNIILRVCSSAVRVSPPLKALIIFLLDFVIYGTAEGQWTLKGPTCQPHLWDFHESAEWKLPFRAAASPLI